MSMPPPSHYLSTASEHSKTFPMKNWASKPQEYIFVKTRQDRAGQGRAEQGRAGQGRAGQAPLLAISGFKYFGPVIRKV